jgi:hypothetical protein
MWTVDTFAPGGRVRRADSVSFWWAWMRVKRERMVKRKRRNERAMFKSTEDPRMISGLL